jgi:hypothetical protein
LDRKILDKFPKTLLEHGPAVLEHWLVFLLSSIVSNSEGRLDPKYENIKAAQELLQYHPELKEGLKSAWMRGKFERIRNLSAPFRDLCVSYST